jgi:hypothetical protein
LVFSAAEEQEIKMQKLEAKYSRLQIASIIQQMGNEMVKNKNICEY